MKCLIRWIDAIGNPTPDSNDAVAMVKLTTAIQKDWIPICADHLKRYEADRYTMAKTGWIAQSIVPACECAMDGAMPYLNGRHLTGCAQFKP
jgi:hypothetical protein